MFYIVAVFSSHPVGVSVMICGSITISVPILFHGVIDLVIIQGRQISTDNIILQETEKNNFPEVFKGQLWIITSMFKIDQLSLLI